MGSLSYGNGVVSEKFDDRTLAHLQLVIISKLRRGERFLFTLPIDQRSGAGRTSVWFDMAIPLRFDFDRAEPYAVNKDWLEELMKSANSPGGLHVTPEPGVEPSRLAS